MQKLCVSRLDDQEVQNRDSWRNRNSIWINSEESIEGEKKRKISTDSGDEI